MRHGINELIRIEGFFFSFHLWLVFQQIKVGVRKSTYKYILCRDKDNDTYEVIDILLFYSFLIKINNK